eukprot:scaffold318_cov110-Cylindrotheca_fusiformis.AAC.2
MSGCQPSLYVRTIRVQQELNWGIVVNWRKEKAESWHSSPMHHNNKNDGKNSRSSSFAIIAIVKIGTDYIS